MSDVLVFQGAAQRIGFCLPQFEVFMGGILKMPEGHRERKKKKKSGWLDMKIAQESTDG